MKVPTYSCLESFINLGVSDVYIADDLCYNLKNVHDICQENNVQMRLILNQVPSMTLDRGINPKAPIFMPKDMDTINPYFDVFEFECGLPYDWAKFDVLYRAWFVNKYWHGQMSEINEDVDMDFHCDAIHLVLPQARLIVSAVAANAYLIIAASVKIFCLLEKS